MRTSWKTLALAGTILTFGAFGCTPQAQQQYGEAGNNATNAADHAANGAATDAKAAGKAVENSARQAEEASAAAEMTTKVKGAILAANDLDSKNINVDTVDKTIHLKGTVKTPAEKTRAEELAKGVAGNDYSVSDELTINPNGSNSDTDEAPMTKKGATKK